MLNAVYKKAKLDIFERCERNEITDSQKKELLTLLEATKAESELTDESIKDFFDQLAEKYPDKKDDIEKLQKKLAKEEESDEKEEEKEDEKEEAPAEEEPVEESVKMKALLEKIIESI